MGSLSNLYISQSYQSLIHLATNNTASATLIGLEDGLGNPIGVSVNTAGNLYLSGTFSASLQEGYLYVGNSIGRTIAFPTSSLVTNINTGSLVTTSSFNAFTASTNIRLSNIELTTASVLVSISNLNSFTQSQQSINSILAGEIDNLEAKTGSYATTGSNTFNGNQTINGTLDVNDGGANLQIGVSGDNIQFNATGGDIIFNIGNDTKFNGDSIVLQNTAGDATFGMYRGTGITQKAWFATVNNTGASGSYVINDAQNNKTYLTLGGTLNNTTINSDVNITGTLTASLQQGYVLVGNASGISSLVATSSFIDTFVSGNLLTTASFNAYTASTNIRLSNIEITTASVLVSISNLNAFTQSANTRLNNLETTSASVNTSITNINAYTQSNDLKWQDLGSKSGSWITESETGSFARYDVSNPWSANQTFTNITAVSASFTYVQTVFETASVIYSSGSNQFGDELTDVQTLSGSVKVQGSLTVNGVPVQTSSFDPSALNQATASLQAFTQSAAISITNLNQSSASQQVSIDALNTFTASQSTASIVNSINELNTFSASALVSINNINSTTASLNTSVTNLNSATASLFGSASLALTTASFDNGTRNLTFTKGDTTTFSVNIPDVTGSTGNFVTTASFNAYTQSNDQRVSSLESNSASVNISIANLNAYTASDDTSISNLEAFTASAAISINNLNTFSASALTSLSNINTFTSSANQRLGSLEAATSSYITESESGSFLITASFASQTLTFTKGDGTTFGLLIPDISGSTIDTGSFVTTSSFNSYTSSNDQRVSSLEANSASVNTSISNINSFTQSANVSISALSAATASYVTETESGSFLITASFDNGTRNLTFTKGDTTTFAVNIPDVSGSTLNTASFATTGSNTFRGNQTLISSSITLQGSGQIQLPNGFTLAGNAGDIGQLSSQTAIQFITEPPAGPGGTNDIKFINRVSGSTIIFQNSQGGAGNGISFEGGNALFDLNIVSGSTGKLVINADGGIDASNSTFTASLQQGYAWVGDFQGISKAVATSSFGGGGSINTGSFATTGSNTFTGDQTLIDAAGNTVTLTDGSGSLILVAKTFTSASTHLSASTNQVNLIFKNNNNTGDTVISGSANIFVNSAAPTAGFRRYISSANIAIGGAGAALPQISSSMAWSPAISNNIFAVSATPLTFRGPVSSSASSISNNIFAAGAVNLGTAAATNFERATNGTTFTGNVINGTLNVVAFKTAFLTSSAMSFTNNNIGGNVTLNADSSSISLAGNTIQAANTRIDNSYYNAAGTGNGNMLNVGAGNIIFGDRHTLYASGSNTTNTLGRNIFGNLIGGTFNSASANLNGDTSSFGATAIIGHALSVTGSSALYTAAPVRNNTYGSAFFGRFNAQDGNKARTAETVFAVGTGTTTTTKTGFLIDSGSNTFIEGTLNVSGSSILSGSLYIQSGSTLPVSTGSAILTWNAATGQVNQASFSTIVSASVSSAEFWSTTTQSGSGGVSGSITFNNSGSFYNVSLVNGTRLTIANAGVYNIQFSAQIETSAGADTVYIWFKKNGTNIGDSASKAVLANNTAQIMTVNILDQAVANDYYEIAYQNINGHATVLAEAASGNIPAIPSVIATIIQIR